MKQNACFISVIFPFFAGTVTDRVFAEIENTTAQNDLLADGCRQLLRNISQKSHSSFSAAAC